MKGECIPVYTDGGASPNPGPGGWGWVALHETLSGTKMLYLCYGGEEHTTNNRMELMAMIDFVENACEDTNYTVYSDSTYVVKGLVNNVGRGKTTRLDKKGVYSGWLKGWKEKNFHKVKNPELWRRLDKGISRYLKTHDFFEIGWVKAHDTSEGNDMADELTWVYRGGRPAKLGGMKMDVY